MYVHMHLCMYIHTYTCTQVHKKNNQVIALNVFQLSNPNLELANAPRQLINKRIIYVPLPLTVDYIDFKLSEIMLQFTLI